MTKHTFTVVLAIFFSCPHIQIIAQIRDIEHVILIGADGVSAEVIRECKESFPNIQKMVKEGTSTLEMRTVLPSHSAANWKSILAGASPELHGFTTCCDSLPDLLPRTLNQYGTFPGIFGLVRDKYPQAELGCIYSWRGIGHLFEKQAVNFDVCIDIADIVVTDSIARLYDLEVLEKSVKYLTDKKPLFTFVYFSQPDVTGHIFGYQSIDYENVIGVGGVDSYIGEIMQVLHNSNMYQNSIVIFIADHGGIGKNHGGKTMQEMQVPYILWGRHIKKNSIIDESLMVYDNAATIAYILGIEQPQAWIGRVVKSAFE
ncbi:MAG: alkaline phosphatase [Prevotellaceae bacterium]|jgi:predicted AlkP superfamily pyrophosphatase or phosphodiesterase|nr:alkaline phosphatase [Prevotellaceae bacterium]